MRDLSLAISSQSVLKNGKSKINSESLTAVNLALLVVIVAVGFLYLFQINTLGTRGYEIRQTEQQIKVLEAENKQLQIQSSGLSSITKIQEDAQALNMVPATDVTYLKNADFALK